MEMIGVEITIFLFAAMLSFVIAKRIGQSAVIAMIFIGVILGPTVLGLVHYSEAVKTLAELGAIFMLFTIGLECNYREIYNTKNFLVAVLGVIVPFAAGWGLAQTFGYTTLEGLFIATALTATSIAITARVLHEKGMLATPVAKTIIGAAVIDDILGLLALSIITSLTGEFTIIAITTKTAIAIAFVVGCILLIKPVNWLMHKIDIWATKEEMHQLPLFAAMCIAFGYAGIAQLIGMSSIIGAFLAGVTLESLHIKSYREGAVYFEMLFSAIFFVSLGIVADLATLSGAWVFAIVIIIVAVLTKLIGCLIPARLAGHSWRESAAIGFGMVPRGEVAMIVGLIGLSSGIIQQELYGVIILMAFVTTIITPLLLNWSLPKSKKEEAPVFTNPES
jgi:Kef-type K+ transport system membrane component KefB